MGDYDWALWLGLAVVLGLVEVTTLDLTFLMLSAGAVAAAGAAGIGAPFALQAVVAIVVAIAMLGVVRPIAIRHLRTPRRDPHRHRCAGRVGGGRARAGRRQRRPGQAQGRGVVRPHL